LIALANKRVPFPEFISEDTVKIRAGVRKSTNLVYYKERVGKKRDFRF
jgi:hypothetical protein